MFEMIPEDLKQTQAYDFDRRLFDPGFLVPGPCWPAFNTGPL